MTDSATSVLSTQAKKLCRDIHFATNVGRDSPFDPFANRDVTKLFSDKYEPSSSLMYFAHKPDRHVPMPVVMSKMPHGHQFDNVMEVTQASYDPTPLPAGKAISFTKAQRFRDSRPRSCGPSDDDEDASRQRASRSDAVLAGSMVSDGMRTTTGDDGAANATDARRRPHSRQLHTPDPTKARGPAFGRMSDRDGRAPSRVANAPVIRAASAQSTARPGEKIVFPWERGANGSPKPGTAGKGARRGGAGSNASPTGSVAPSMAASQRRDDASLAASGIGSAPGKDGGPTAAEEHEAWLEKRKLLINRFGLTGGNDRRRRQSERVRAPDITAMPGREKVMKFHAPGKEKNDLMYDPKITVTTKTRSVAHVELGKQAGRWQRGQPHVQRVEELLNVDNLSRLHQRHLRRERSRQWSRDPSSTAPVFEGKPLSAADEFAYNTTTLRPPKPRHVAHTTDALLCADRPDEPLAAVLGGDAGKYRRAAQKDVAATWDPSPPLL